MIDVVPVDQLRCSDWAGFITCASRTTTRTVHFVLDETQGTSCDVSCTKIIDGGQALKLWEQGDLDDREAVVHTPCCLEGAEYLGVRAAQSAPLGHGNVLLWQVLLRAWSFACKGGVLQLSVPGKVFGSRVLLPFRSISSLAWHAQLSREQTSEC